MKLDFHLTKTAYRERKTITRGKKESFGKEKVWGSGKSKNQSTGRKKNSHLYQGGSSLIVGDRTGSVTGYITLLCSCLTCTQIQADRKNIKDREMRESVSTKVVRVSSTSALNKPCSSLLIVSSHREQENQKNLVEK